MTDPENQTNKQVSEQKGPAEVQGPDVTSLPKPEKTEKNDSPHQQESDRLKKWKELIANNPKDIIHDCLSASFSSHSDISDFCFYYFEPLSKELRETDGYERIIRRLIQYCNEHGLMEDLWLHIKEKRINQYNIYYPKWKQVNMRTNDSIGQFDKPGSITREKPLAPDGGSQPHPLSGNNRAAINDWFYNELESQEKSMVLTVALFEGINRKLMIPISHEIERRLFEKT